MQAFLIDPANQIIRAVEYNGDYREIYQHIGADCFDVARFAPNGDCVFIDDEGMLKNPQHFFSIVGYGPGPEDGGTPFGGLLAGKGLVLGTDEEGNSIAPRGVTLDWLWGNVLFYVKLPGDLGIMGTSAESFRPQGGVQ